MPIDELDSALRQGRTLIGTLVVSPSPHWLPVLVAVGLDLVFIDTEHISQDRMMVSWMCRAYAAAGLAPIVRIPAPDPYLACMALDGGAVGVIAPYVESVAQVRSLVGAVKLRPLKGRRLEAVLAGEERLDPALASYLARVNRGRALIINIESTPGMEALSELCAQPGLDAVLVGPHDLSISLGCPESYDDQHWNTAVETILATARGAGIGAGVHGWFGVARSAGFARSGANLIIHHGDISMVADGLHRDLVALRSQLAMTSTARMSGADPGSAAMV